MKRSTLGGSFFIALNGAGQNAKDEFRTIMQFEPERKLGFRDYLIVQGRRLPVSGVVCFDGL